MNKLQKEIMKYNVRPINDLIKLKKSHKDKYILLKTRILDGLGMFFHCVGWKENIEWKLQLRENYLI